MLEESTSNDKRTLPRIFPSKPAADRTTAQPQDIKHEG